MKNDQVLKIRSFNRFYTKTIGLIDRYYLNTPYSLTQLRVLYETRYRTDCTARKILKDLQLDEGYLSRVIDGFIKDGILKKSRSQKDGRVFYISLTEKGRDFVESLDEKANQSIGELTNHLTEDQLDELTKAMQAIKKHLSTELDD